MSASTPLARGSLEARLSTGETSLTRDAVLEQVERILASSLFRHSRRCGPLLKYVVVETLEGRAEFLKERAIGIAVFGRKPAYDTNEDPIVRSSAVEVRKRIAQYYHEAGHENELRIDMTSGSYIAKFRPPASETAASAPAAGEKAAADLRTAAPPPSEHIPAMSAPVPSERRTLLLSGVALATVVVAVTLGLMARSILANGPINLFWGPLLQADQVTLVMGNAVELAPQVATSRGPHEASFYDTIMADRVGFVDGLTVARVAALLASKGRKFEIRRGGSLNLEELRKTPAVMVGAFNNPWTSKLEEDLRFRFVIDYDTRSNYLQDRQNPTKPLWKIEQDVPYSSLKEDRAIITRFIDARTEQTVLLLAGFGRDGTAAAGEFVTEPRYLRTLPDRAPRGWQGRNVQAVIATDLVSGHSGAPRLIASYFW